MMKSRHRAIHVALHLFDCVVVDDFTVIMSELWLDSDFCLLSRRPRRPNP